jgi:hypothetical protein
LERSDGDREDGVEVLFRVDETIVEQCNTDDGRVGALDHTVYADFSYVDFCRVLPQCVFGSGVCQHVAYSDSF